MIYAYSRPRYQVSVYRTIGPLVFYLKIIIFTAVKYCSIIHRPVIVMHFLT